MQLGMGSLGIAARTKRFCTRTATPLFRLLNRRALHRLYRRSQHPLPPLPRLVGPLLFVFPHVDDETIAAGGVLLRAAGSAVPVDLVYTTDSSAGGMGATRTERAATRLGEAHELAAHTSIRAVRVLSGENERLVDTADVVRGELVGLLGRERYGAVFAVSPVDAHHEHRTSARIIADALVASRFAGPVHVGENSNLLPRGLWTHALALSRPELLRRQSLLGLFRSQKTMGFEVYRDLARAKRVLAPGSYAAEFFYRTNAAGYARLVGAVERLDVHRALPHRIGNSWSLQRAIRPFAPDIEAALVEAASAPE